EVAASGVIVGHDEVRGRKGGGIAVPEIPLVGETARSARRRRGEGRDLSGGRQIGVGDGVRRGSDRDGDGERRGRRGPVTAATQGKEQPGEKDEGELHDGGSISAVIDPPGRLPGPGTIVPGGKASSERNFAREQRASTD